MLRGLARRLLGVTFVVGGIEALRDADRRARQLDRHGELGGADPQQVARGLAGAQIAAGGLLVLNRFPRLSSLVLAATVVPEAATAHAFWAESDKQHSETQRTLFMRDLGLLGGLLVSVDDKGRRHSMGRRARRAAKSTAKNTARAAKGTAKAAVQRVH
ncbi:MAG TPA: DoxX family protein [Mycobacteriales bacterium]|nr:DoxX family protein [Mycobacteriales bacterium]